MGDMGLRKAVTGKGIRAGEYCELLGDPTRKNRGKPHSRVVGYFGFTAMMIAAAIVIPEPTIKANHVARSALTGKNSS